MCSSLILSEFSFYSLCIHSLQSLFPPLFSALIIHLSSLSSLFFLTSSSIPSIFSIFPTFPLFPLFPSAPSPSSSP
ncbi:MAG: hypothetical protein JOS17DRAFT_737171 [Linnemannia elongata]|nr:MAG: hypothetical protein JOS17DRAFT_737171 [Linnemannia elongata]